MTAWEQAVDRMRNGQADAYDGWAEAYVPEDGSHRGDGSWVERLVDGADWLLSGTDTPEPMWGEGDRMLAVRRQPLVIAGAQGAGKTVLGGHLMLGTMGVPGFGKLLGLPVMPTERRVLYLAADRPDQARLSLLRMVEPELVRGRLVVWQGPPPSDVAKRPTILLELAEAAGASLIVVDSLKDVALKLSDDEVGASVNLAVQHCIAEGIDVVALHHPRKVSGDESTSKVRTIDDLYGSSWLTTGAGSVLYLRPTTPGTVELAQLKTPVGVMTTLTFRHSPSTGRVELGAERTLLDVVREADAQGITTIHAARCLYGLEDVPDATRKRVERMLKDLADEELVEKVDKRWVAR